MTVNSAIVPGLFPHLGAWILCESVIYMNTFSKTLTPAIRISYMVLPEKLMRRYIDTANFYCNTASTCEQYALARFIENGYFERHLSRLKKFYHAEGERLKRILKTIGATAGSQRGRRRKRHPPAGESRYFHD